jgi:trigger factor
MSTTEMEANQTSPQPLQLEVKVDKPQTCLRHLVVTVPRSEVDRYMKMAYDKLAPTAAVRGFRAGRAPRQVLEKAFRPQIIEQVKGSLIMDSISRATEEAKLNPIGEPDFAYEAIEVPETGNFTYEFKIEVRPEFETPKWQGLKLRRLVETIDDAGVDRAIHRVVAGTLNSWEATDQPVRAGDQVLVTISVGHEGKVLHTFDEAVVPVYPSITWTDGRCDDFASSLAGAAEGEHRKISVTLSDFVTDEALRGKTVEGDVEVLEVRRQLEINIDSQTLKDLGDFNDITEFRSFVAESLSRQAGFRQRQDLREQVVRQLITGADWDLPESLVMRQTRRELERKALELQRSSFGNAEIKRYLNAVRADIVENTRVALREHFILEQIAEDEKIEPSEDDYNREIELIAEQSDMPPRRVRARLEKTGQLDALRNQIVENIVLDRIIAAASLTEEPVAPPKDPTEFAIEESAIGARDTSHIPEAKYDDKSVETKDSLPKNFD